MIYGVADPIPKRAVRPQPRPRPPLPLKRGRGTSAQVEAASLWAAPLPVRPDRSLLLLAMSEVHFSDPGGTRGPLDWRFPGGRE